MSSGSWTKDFRKRIHRRPKDRKYQALNALDRAVNVHA